MRIGQLSEHASVSPATVRYYEHLGLMVEPRRTSAGYRDYGTEALERLRFIRDAQTAGLSLTQVSEVLKLKAEGQSSCEHTASVLKRHVEDIDAQVVALMATRAEILRLVARADALDPEQCSNPNRCQVIGA